MVIISEFKNLSGQRFGNLQIIKLVGTEKDKGAIWFCKCDCGKTTKVVAKNLKSNHTKSCGCLRRISTVKKNTKHNESGSRLYGIWLGMKKRCTNKNEKSYIDYGGRGITVCDEWRQYTTFRGWALSNGYKDDLTIERIDVNGNYEPKNCTWIPNSEQPKNQRNSKKMEVDGIVKTIKEWAILYNVKYTTLYSRIKKGWKPEIALNS